MDKDFKDHTLVGSLQNGILILIVKDDDPYFKDIQDGYAQDGDVNNVLEGASFKFILEENNLKIEGQMRCNFIIECIRAGFSGGESRPIDYKKDVKEYHLIPENWKYPRIPKR